METKCDICGRAIAKSNTHRRIIDGVRYVLCGKHYAQYVNHGVFLDSDPNSLIYNNTYEFIDDVVIVHTYKRGTGSENGSFKIDRADFERVKSKHWRRWKNDFFTGNTEPVLITRFLFCLKRNDIRVVDHINGDRTDNRRSNLRVVYQAQNCMNKGIESRNTSGITGVSWDKPRDRWAVEIRCDYLRAHLGRYIELSDACYVRLVAEILLFGEFRNHRNDNIVIPCASQCNRKEELCTYVIEKLSSLGFMFQPNYSDCFHSVLGVNLASDNQYAERIS